MVIMSTSTRGRRPGPSTTHEEILHAAKECLHEFGFEKSTLRKIADRAGVSDSLLIHQFGTRENLLVEALDAPAGLERAFNLMRRFPKPVWGRLLAEAVERGEVRHPEGREHLELLVRASTQSAACAQMLHEWVLGELTEQIAALGLTEPQLRARALATVLFGMTFTHEVLGLGAIGDSKSREQVKIRGRIMQAILSKEL